MAIPYADGEFYKRNAPPAGHSARDMVLAARVTELEDSGGAALASLQDQIDANDAVDAAQQAIVDTNAATNAAQQSQLDANDAVDAAQQAQIDANDAVDAAQQALIDGKEDIGVADALDFALENQIIANADLAAAQQAQIDAADALAAAQQAEIDAADALAASQQAAIDATDTLNAAQQALIESNKAKIDANEAAIAAIKKPAWVNPDGSEADSTSSDVEHNAGTVKFGAYADGFNEITAPTGLYSRESDGTMKVITLAALGNLLGVTPRPITIEGYVITGQLLSIVDYGGVGGPSDAHQWYAEGTPIVGATGVTYTTTPIDEGTKITVKVNGEESNILRNFYPSDVGPQIWFDPSQSLSGELVNVGTGDPATLSSGAEQPLAAYNGLPVNHMKGQTYTLPDQFNGAAENLTFVTTWVENARTTNTVFKLSATETDGRSQMHIPWSDGTVYFDVQGIDDRFNTNIGPVGQALMVSYQNNPTDATATIYRSGDPDPANPYNVTNSFISASETTAGSMFGANASDHYMLDTIISSAELSLPAKQKLEAYVAWKYNIPEILPPSHPYKLAPA